MEEGNLSIASVRSRITIPSSSSRHLAVMCIVKFEKADNGEEGFSSKPPLLS
jgi:hypothetical protein